MSQDDQKVSKEGDVCSKKSFFNRVDYFKADQAQLHARDGNRLAQYFRLIILNRLGSN